ncbi:hypothetical protein J2P12_06015 [Candidatus Bathyarchaeota archaeon]|nr:hypothetical protein [Candidatus Bathyarchaeota archaeon]
MSELTLEFYGDSFDDAYMRVKWPNDRPRLRAFVGAHPQRVKSVNTNFIMGNTPSGYTVFFVAGTSHAVEHENMKRSLKIIGVPFEEGIITIGETTVGLFNRRKVEKKGQFVFGTTDKGSVVNAIFDGYELAWKGEGWSLVFFVAKEEPSGWKNIINSLSVGQPYSQEMIEKSHCIMETQQEHGMSIASVEISQGELTKIASQIAKDLSMYLTVRDRTKTGRT